MAELVSIIMPAYKARDHILRSVQSVLAQTYEDWELLIVSDDQFDYQEFLKGQGVADERIRHFSTGGVGTGICRGRNTGVRHARGNIIASLDADDCFMPDKLSLCVPKVQEHGMVTSALDIRDEKGAHLRIVGNISEDRVLSSSEYKNIHYTGDSVHLYDKARFPVSYNEDVAHLEDLQFMMDCFEYTDKIYYFCKPLHIYYKRLDSLSNQDSYDGFMHSKQRILSDLRSDKQDFKDKKTKDSLISFLEISLAAEERFSKEEMHSENIIFEDLMEKMLKDGGPGET